MKNELEKKNFYVPLNNSMLNLPKDTMNSIAELRINALPWELCLGSHSKEVSELMKIHFGLTTFYQCFEYCQRGLPCFTVFRVEEKETIYGFNVNSTNTNGIYCVVKTML